MLFVCLAAISLTLRYQQRAVAIAQEAEIVCQSIIINLVPITMYECTYEKQQGALRLMEIGYQHLHNIILITWSYDYLGTGMQSAQPVLVKIRQYVLYCLEGRNGLGYGILVRLPLAYVEFFLGKVKSFFQLHTYII